MFVIAGAGHFLKRTNDMIIVISVLVFAFTGFLTWVFFEHDLEDEFYIAFIVLALEVIGVVGAVPVYLSASYSCSKVAEKLGMEHDYSFFTGCFVKDDNGRWYNYEQQRIVK
jgi:membrane protein YdbS with pleckstrin-like domain